MSAKRLLGMSAAVLMAASPCELMVGLTKYPEFDSLGPLGNELGIILKYAAAWSKYSDFQTAS